MNAQTRHSARLALTDAKRLFDLTNPEEARALDWVRRFHRGGYKLLAVRVQRGHGGYSVRTLTCRRTKQPGTRSEWMSIVYQADSTGITIRWHTARTLREARTAFRATQ